MLAMNESQRNRRLISCIRAVVTRARALFPTESSECRALLWSWLYIFSLFLAYYVLRPIREELGVAGGVKNLPWLFTGTLVVMIAINPLFAWVVRRWPRERFIAITYRFFMANLLIFTLLLAVATPEQRAWIGRGFFIWVSVFNLFVISVFWSFVVDVFSAGQARRLFGILATGATTGGIAGSALTSGLVDVIGQNGLMFVSIALLEIAVYAARRLSALSDAFRRPLESEEGHRPVGGGIFTGFIHTFRSPYLMGIAGFIMFYSLTSTVLYFHQASIAEQHFADREARTAFFAGINLWVNGITLIIQLFLTGRILSWAGLALTLSALPLMSVLGFTSLALFPGITVFVIFQVMRNVSNYALTRPAREILFTSVSREDRFKTKNFIDTVMYRAGDQVAAWTYAGLMMAGLSIAGIAMLSVPFSIIWLGLSFWLGLRQQRWEKNKRESEFDGITSSRQ